MSEFDDDRIERLLGAAGGAFPNVNTAYAQVQGRVRHIKQRRAMVAGTAACVLLAAGAVFALGSAGQRGSLQPGDNGSLSVDTSEVETESTLSTDSTLTTDSTSANPAPTTSEGSTSGSSGHTASSQPSVPSTSIDDSTATSTHSSAPANTAPQTYTCAGGSITVKVTNGALELLSSQPAADFTLESSSATATRIDVRWRSSNDDQRIRIDLIGGVPVRKV